MWISTKDHLPEEGKYVLARHNRGTWHDSTDQENVNCVVVKLKRGISEDQRTKMKKGELSDPIIPRISNCGAVNFLRSSIYSKEDEHDNNLVPYCWIQFGPDDFFGQTITHWMPIPPL
jgi:hypothetical protein